MAVKLISKADKVDQAIERRKRRAAEMSASAERDAILESLENSIIPHPPVKQGIETDLSKITAETSADAPEKALREFIASSDFTANWYTRQRYEVDAGRDEEPILYDGIYTITVDPTLAKNVEILTFGPAGIVFEEVKEGGEVVFVTLNESDATVPIKNWASGIRYSEDLFIYNQMFQVAEIDRQFGRAWNARDNNIHFWPILNQSYVGANLTDGTASPVTTKFKKSASMAEKYARTLEAAITASRMDKANPRRGPYALVVSSADSITAEFAVTPVPQQGFGQQSRALGRIRNITEYDGWSGTRGKKQHDFAGVQPGEAFLVDLANRRTDFRSLVKQPLRSRSGNPDVSRFIMEQTVYNSRVGVYANPLRSVQKILWPEADSGTD